MAEKEQFALVAEALSGIMYDIDLSTGDVKRTQGIQKLIGADAVDATENVLWWMNRIHPDDLGRVKKAFATTEDHCEVEYRVRHTKGQYIYILDQAIIIRDKNNIPIRIVGCNIDISRQKLVENRLRRAWKKEQRLRLQLEIITTQVKKLQIAEQEALQREKKERERAEAANRAKDEFLANLSHELRSPLQSILGWIQLMRRSKLDPETADRALDTIERNTKAQTQLVNDILDVSKIITGAARIELTQVDVRKILQNALDSILPAASAKQIRLKLIANCENAFVLGDEFRLQQVFWNLFSNAIKFTPPDGSVTVELFIKESQVIVRITDSGCGIEADLLPYVFDRFKQGDSSTTREHSGLGLGLSIVKHLIELHGGHVKAQSAGRDKGSIFELTLLLKKDLVQKDLKCIEKTEHIINTNSLTRLA